MIVGVDFDNTVVCYDDLFYRSALEKKLIPDSTKPAKSEIRNHLRKMGNEDAWTELQGHVYGPGMADAPPYPGVLDFFKACEVARVNIFIISHRTLHPFIGPKHDLHDSARSWIRNHGLKVPVHLELTKDEKCARIFSSRCDYFVDDLPEFLTDPVFPDRVSRILFDPGNIHPDDPKYQRTGSWLEIKRTILGKKNGA